MLAFYKIFCEDWTLKNGGQLPLLSFGDLMEEDYIKELVERNESHDEIRIEVWKALEEVLPDVIEGMRKRMDEHHLSLIGDNGSTEVSTTASTLQRATTFFSSVKTSYGYSNKKIIPSATSGLSDGDLQAFIKSLDIKEFMSYSDIQDNYRKLTCPSWTYGRRWILEVDRDKWNKKDRVFNCWFAKAARALLASLGISEDIDMASIEKCGKAFRCGLCAAGKPVEWKGLVSLYALICIIWWKLIF